MRIFFGAIVLLLSLFIPTRIMAESMSSIEFFWANGCPHCVKEKVFLNELQKKYPDLEIKSYEISQSLTNAMLLEAKGKELEADISGVPFTIIGDQFISGYQSDETTGKKIEDLIFESRTANETLPDKQELTLPILGTLDLRLLSLPLLTLVVAAVDGFNPCAMWALVFLISLLLGIPDRKRRWILGLAFIATSAFVYFLFLTAWLNLFLFVGMLPLIRLIIAALTLFAGYSYLRDYFRQDSSCHVSAPAQRQLFFGKLQSLVQKESIFIAIIGVITLSFLVNLVEFFCSAGLPAIYTHILSLSDLSTWQYYGYLILYVTIFMLDDLLIFTLAMLTLETTGISSRYTHLSRLIGGILMLGIGLLLLFNPSLLMLG